MDFVSTIRGCAGAEFDGLDGNILGIGLGSGPLGVGDPVPGLRVCGPCGYEFIQECDGEPVGGMVVETLLLYWLSCVSSEMSEDKKQYEQENKSCSNIHVNLIV